MLSGNHFALKWAKSLTIGFALLMVFFMILSEFFQIPQPPPGEAPSLQSPLLTPLLNTLDTLTVSNSLGTTHVSKRGDSWHLHTSGGLPARKELVEQIIHSLKTINVHHFYEKDNINLRSFSLDNPTVEIHLGALDKSQKIKIGLINTIDDSTYLMEERSALIYQIDILPLPLHSLGLEDFIDSRLFRKPLENIQKLRILQNLSPRKSRATLTLIRTDQSWQNAKAKKLDPQKTNDWLAKFLAQKAEVILDKKSPKLEEHIKKTMARPFYTVVLTQKDGKEVSHRFSRPLTSLPDLTLEKKSFVLVTGGNGTHPLLADKSVLDLLKTKARAFRPGKKSKK